MLFLGLVIGITFNSVDAQTPAASDFSAATGQSRHFDVTTYVVDDDRGLLPAYIWGPILSPYTGPDVSLEEIVKGAARVQTEYRNRGYPMMSVAIAQERVANGVVTLNVFQTAIPQIIVSGVRYYCPTNAETVPVLPAIAPVLVPENTNAVVTQTTAPTPVPPPPPLVPATPEQKDQAYKSLLAEMALLDKAVPDTRIHVVSTNAGPHFDVERYDIQGNTILSPHEMAAVLTNIDGAFGNECQHCGD